MSSIYTIVPDINHLLTQNTGWWTEELSLRLTNNLTPRLEDHFNRKQCGTLRLSKIGTKCPRALWYSVHHPELEQPLPPDAKLKYAYGHILEALLIQLAKAAGHEVTGEQDAVSVDGVVGHRDLVLDGCICDVKSTSTLGFQKFEKGTLWQDDGFGYLEQLDGYVCGSLEDPLVRVKDKAYILAVDKQLGHLALYEHKFREEYIRSRIAYCRQVVERKEPPLCACGTKPMGESGNIQLGTTASYSPYKFCCFPNLRTFIYSKGPVYLTEVVREPDVLEVDKNGQPVH